MASSRHHSQTNMGPMAPYLFGGEGGIRTLGTVTRTLDFESSPFGQLRHLSEVIKA